MIMWLNRVENERVPQDDYVVTKKLSNEEKRTTTTDQPNFLSEKVVPARRLSAEDLVKHTATSPPGIMYLLLA